MMAPDILIMARTEAAAAAVAVRLEPSGLTVIGCAIDDGPALAAGKRPRLVLLDLTRGALATGEDVGRLIAQVRAMEPPALRPVLILTADLSVEHVQALLRAGASDIVPDSAPDELLVHRLLLQRQLLDQHQSIERKRRYEKAVADCARLLAAGGAQSVPLDQITEIVQRCTGVSRAYVFRTEQDPVLGIVASQIHEACAPGIAPQAGNPELQRMLLSSVAPAALAHLVAGRSFSGRIGDLDEPERSLLACQGILDIVILPIFCGKELWGFMGFDDCESTTSWDSDDIDLLKIVVEATGLAIDRTRAEQEIHRLATQDPLTGLHNRRYMMNRMEDLVSQATRDGSRFALALLDIDRFKAVNDTHGHGTGDRVLQHFAAELSRFFRPYDLVCRHGGEEFLVVILSADPGQLAGRLDRLRGKLAREPMPHETGELLIRFSAGVVGSGEIAGRLSMPALLDLADRRMYEAKHAGRDRVVAAGAGARR